MCPGSEGLVLVVRTKSRVLSVPATATTPQSRKPAITNVPSSTVTSRQADKTLFKDFKNRPDQILILQEISSPTHKEFLVMDVQLYVYDLSRVSPMDVASKYLAYNV